MHYCTRSTACKKRQIPSQAGDGNSGGNIARRHSTEQFADPFIFFFLLLLLLPHIPSFSFPLACRIAYAEPSVTKCQKKCEKEGGTIFAYNLKSHHCFSSTATNYSNGAASTHETSGCDPSKVKGCSATPPPTPVPNNGLFPKWTAALPKPAEPMGG